MMILQKIFFFSYVLLLSIGILSIHGQVLPFCSTYCVDYVFACYGQGENDCYGCAQSIFHIQHTTSRFCQFKNRTQILFYQMRNSAFNFTGYSSSKPTPYLCNIYWISGQYVAGDYLEKSFTNLPTNHFQLIIRFAIAYIGFWNKNDEMQLTVDRDTYIWKHEDCFYPQPLCSSSNLDCIKFKQQIVSHRSTNVSLRFSTLITQTNPNQKNWGIKDLLIAARLCDDRCQTCFGPTASECISCVKDYYLIGNLCSQTCYFFSLEDKRICVQECPEGYYQSSNKICSLCQRYCLICADPNSCEVWSNEKPGVVWENNKLYFILIIVISIIVLPYAIWKLALKKYLKKTKEKNQDLKKKMVSENALDEDNGRFSNCQIKSNRSENHSHDQDQNIEINQKKLQQKTYENNESKSVIRVEQQFAWQQEIPSIPTIDQILVSNPKHEQKRKKKKRFKSAGGSIIVDLKPLEPDRTNQ